MKFENACEILMLNKIVAGRLMWNFYELTRLV